MELFVSHRGSWSIVAVPKDGCARMLGSGIAAYPVPKKSQETGS